MEGKASLRRMMIPFIIVMTLLVSETFAGDVVLVCHKSVPEDSLTRRDIKNIFLGKKTEWADSQKIVFVTLKGSEAHEFFLREYLGKTMFQYANYWKKQLFTGKGRPPRSFDTDTELIKYVANTKGAIGYVSSGADRDSVKVVSVN